MSKIIQQKRHIDGNWVTCDKCRNVIMVDKPLVLDMPYCAECGKIIYDANQKFCAWCGVNLDNE